MTRIIFVLCLFVSCKPIFKNQSSSMSQASLLAHVYFEESEELVEISSLNQQSKSLRPFDQLVFSNENYFRKHRNKNQDLTLSDSSKGMNFNFKANAFCASSEKELLEENSTRKIKEIFSPEIPSHLSIVDLIPKSFLAQSLNSPFYCSFIFHLNSKSYFLIHQKVDPIPSEERSPFGLSLLMKTASGLQKIDSRNVLRKKDLPFIMGSNNADQKIDLYDLYCEGSQVLSVSSLIDSNAIFSKLSDFESLPGGIQFCRFFSKSKDQTIGISSAFRLDFDDLSLEYQSLDLKNFSRPRFRFRKKGFGSIEFKDLEGLDKNLNYKSIDMKTQVECISKNRFLDEETVLTKTTLMPLQKRFSIMSITPEIALMKLGISYNHYLYRRHLLSHEYDHKKSEIEGNKYERDSKEWFKRELDIERKRLNLREEHENEKKFIKEDLYEARLDCVYKIQLQDQNNSSNQIEFSPTFQTVKWRSSSRESSITSRSGYGVSYAALNETGKTPFLRSYDIENLQEEAFKKLSFKDRLFFKLFMYEDLIDIDEIKSYDHSLHLGFFDKESSGKRADIHRMAVKCYKESIETPRPFNKNVEIKLPLQFVEKYWFFDNFSHNDSLSLYSLLSDDELMEFIKSDEISLIVCRVLFYSQYKGEYFLKYFSPEISFKSD